VSFEQRLADRKQRSGRGPAHLTDRPAEQP
jgi:hypothetical protein